MDKHPILGLMETTIQKIREMVDANTIVGEPIQTGNVTLVPVSKISVGFASGGSDFGKKKQDEDGRSFGGGGGAGITVTPEVFIVISGDNVRVLSVDSAPQSPAERIIDMLPKVIEKTEEFLDSRKPKDEEKREAE